MQNLRKENNDVIIQEALTATLNEIIMCPIHLLAEQGIALFRFCEEVTSII